MARHTKQNSAKNTSDTPPPTQRDVEYDVIERLSQYGTELLGTDMPVRNVLDKYVGLGSELLRNNPERFEQTVQQIFEAASFMKESEARKFLQERVVRQTFTFQARFEELVAPSLVDLSLDFACHINEVSVLLSIPNKTLKPPSILNPDSSLDEDDPLNRLYVYFATGKIDRLSTFLVGHALLRAPGLECTRAWKKPAKESYQMHLAEAWACEATGQLFSKKFMLAVVRPDYSHPSASTDIHEIESPVRPNGGHIDLFKMSGAVQVNLIEIHPTVLLPGQRREIEQESYHYKSAAMTARGRTEEPFEFAKQYVTTRHAELSLKLALLELWEANFAN